MCRFGVYVTQFFPIRTLDVEKRTAKMSTPNFDIVSSKIVLIGKNSDAAQTADLRQTFQTTVDDDFLRRAEAEIRRAQSTAKNATALEQLDSLLKVSEARRECILQAKAAREKSTDTSAYDKAFSDQLNADIQFVAETTEDATLQRALSSIAASRDLQSLQNAVKKLAAVRADIHLQPSDASFAKKGLSARDWTVKLKQIDTALQTRMNELAKLASAARNAPLVVGDCAKVVALPAPGETAYEFFMRFLWLWISLLVLLVVVIVVIVVMTQRKSAQSPAEDPQLSRGTNFAVAAPR